MFFTHGFATSKASQTKKNLSKLSPKKSIPPLNDKVFDYLHKQVDDFLQVCANNV